MEDPIIQFFSESISFDPEQPDQLRKWLEQTAIAENHDISFLNYVFCNDDYLLDINRQYLDHDDYTDVITFPYNEEGDSRVEGDIFISIDRIHENSDVLSTGFNTELHRVMVHGLLHLLGYTDKEDADKLEMTEKEDYYLSLLR